MNMAIRGIDFDFGKEPADNFVLSVAAVEAKADTLKAKLTALEQLKKPLMHDLLTGSVRIRI